MRPRPRRWRCGRVDDDELGAAHFARLRDMGHRIDLGRDRVTAPYDDQVGFGHFAPVAATLEPASGMPAGIGQCAADRRMLPRIVHRVAQPLQPVVLHQSHRAAVEMRPHRLGPVALRRPRQLLGDFVERDVPGDRHESGAADAFAPKTPHWLGQPVRVVLALGVAGHLGANNAPCISLGGGPANPPDARSIDPLDLQRAGARAVMRADAGQNIERQGCAPPWALKQNIRSVSPGRYAAR